MPLVGLRPNERVRTPDGLGTVVSVDAVGGEQPVWNLEVHGTHTYHAGSGGVLVHNTGNCNIPKGFVDIISGPKNPRLIPIHGLAKNVLDFWRSRSTKEILDSLKPGQKEALSAWTDGRICNGHHRISILRERGVNVDELPRLVRDPLGDLGLPPGIE